MKYQVGDKIIVLHSDEEGTVIDIINEKMVMIDVRGVKFPAYMDQIDFPYFKMFTQQRVGTKKKMYIDEVRKEKPAKKVKTGEGVHLSLMPVFDKDVFDDDLVHSLKVFLINENDEAYHFDYNIYFGGQESSFQLKGVLEPLSEFYLHDIDYDDISDNPKFAVVFSLVKENKKKAPYFETSQKVNGKKVFKKVSELLANQQQRFSFELFKVYPDKTQKDSLDLSKLNKSGFKVYQAEQAKEYMPPARSVIDIHIEKLTDNFSRLSGTEIMEIQLNEFEKYYDLAVFHHLKEFTVIHGVGEGKLRDEIHNRLKAKKAVKTFVNQYHHLYGFGATEIFFK